MLPCDQLETDLRDAVARLARQPLAELLLQNGILRQLASDQLRRRLCESVQFTAEEAPLVISRLFEGVAVEPPSALAPGWIEALPPMLQGPLSDRWDQIRLQKWMEDRYRDRLDAYFLERREDLEQVVYGMIRLRHQGIAEELYLRLLDDEADFGDLARQYSLGDERFTRGLVGPMRISQPHQSIRSVLQKLAIGDLHPPFVVDNWVLLVRMEHRQPAQLTDSTMLQLCQELLQQELDATLDAELQGLYPSLLEAYPAALTVDAITVAPALPPHAAALITSISVPDAAAEPAAGVGGESPESRSAVREGAAANITTDHLNTNTNTNPNTDNAAAATNNTAGGANNTGIDTGTDASASPGADASPHADTSAASNTDTEADTGADSGADTVPGSRVDGSGLDAAGDAVNEVAPQDAWAHEPGPSPVAVEAAEPERPRPTRPDLEPEPLVVPPAQEAEPAHPGLQVAAAAAAAAEIAEAAGGMAPQQTDADVQVAEPPDPAPAMDVAQWPSPGSSPVARTPAASSAAVTTPAASSPAASAPASATPPLARHFAPAASAAPATAAMVEPPAVLAERGGDPPDQAAVVAPPEPVAANSAPTGVAATANSESSAVAAPPASAVAPVEPVRFTPAVTGEQAQAGPGRAARPTGVPANQTEVTADQTGVPATGTQPTPFLQPRPASPVEAGEGQAPHSESSAPQLTAPGSGPRSANSGPGATGAAAAGLAPEPPAAAAADLPAQQADSPLVPPAADGPAAQAPAQEVAAALRASGLQASRARRAAARAVSPFPGLFVPLVSESQAGYSAPYQSASPEVQSGDPPARGRADAASPSSDSRQVDRVQPGGLPEGTPSRPQPESGDPDPSEL